MALSRYQFNRGERSKIDILEELNEEQPMDVEYNFDNKVGVPRETLPDLDFEISEKA